MPRRYVWNLIFVHFDFFEGQSKQLFALSVRKLPMLLCLICSSFLLSPLLCSGRDVGKVFLGARATRRRLWYSSLAALLTLLVCLSPVEPTDAIARRWGFPRCLL